MFGCRRSVATPALIRHARAKSSRPATAAAAAESTKMADILRQNAKSYRPTANFNTSHSAGPSRSGATPPGPSSPVARQPQTQIHSFTANEALQHGFSDLSSVASMNTILGILEDAQKSQAPPPAGASGARPQPKDEEHTARFRAEGPASAGPANSGAAASAGAGGTGADASASSNASGPSAVGISYLDHFFNLSPSPAAPAAAAAGQKLPIPSAPPMAPAAAASQSLYRSAASAELGKDILEYIFVRYLNDQGVSERGLAGDVERLGIYQRQLAQLAACFESQRGSSSYERDDTLTMNGSLNTFQAISMHFIKRPQAAVALLSGEVSAMVRQQQLSAKLGGPAAPPPADSAIDVMVDELQRSTGSPAGASAPRVGQTSTGGAGTGSAATEYETPAAATYKLPHKFTLASPEIRASHERDPRVISPIYTKYDLGQLQGRKYLVQIPFILNDYEVISRVLTKSNASDVSVLQGILASQSLEGAKLYDILIRQRLMRSGGGAAAATAATGAVDTSALLDPVIKAAVSTTSNLLWKGNAFSQKLAQSFSERTFDGARTVALLEQQFNVYFSVWYRLGPADATQWCHNLVDHYRHQPVSHQELESLRSETLAYFKFQARSDKAHKFIVEEEKLASLVRALLTARGSGKVPQFY